MKQASTLDLNCDLGEGELDSRTRALMRWATSVNVACGGHAGSVKSMQRCVELAKRFSVLLGAHPGPWSRGDLGRGAVQITPDEFELLLIQQVGALDRIARSKGVCLHHIKLHGALYHASEANAGIGRRYVESVARWWPEAIIYSQASGSVASLAKRSGVKVWEEAFVDRGYQDTSGLVPRNKPGALLTDSRVVQRRVQMILDEGVVESVSGRRLALNPQTLCVHSDTLNAPRIAREVRRVLNGQSLVA